MSQTFYQQSTPNTRRSLRWAIAVVLLILDVRLTVVASQLSTALADARAASYHRAIVFEAELAPRCQAS